MRTIGFARHHHPKDETKSAEAYDPEFYERFATEAGWYAGR
jgi:hypothetical protein